MICDLVDLQSLENKRFEVEPSCFNLDEVLTEIGWTYDE